MADYQGVVHLAPNSKISEFSGRPAYYGITLLPNSPKDFRIRGLDANGGLGKMWQLFEEKTGEIINELNEVLAA